MQKQQGVHTTPINDGHNQISMGSELVRKCIHLASVIISVFYSYSDKSTVLWVLVPMTMISVFFDYGRHYSNILNKFVTFTFGAILREHEKDSSRKLLSGATYVLISAIVCIIIFPKVIAITAFTILIICDTAGALIGRRFGTHRFFDKSREGSIAFIVSGIAVVFVTPKISSEPGEFVVGIVGVVVAAIVEAASTRLKLDDNFSIPLSAGGTMWGAYYLLAWLVPIPYQSIVSQLMN
jgi:dolichol kinase